MQCDGRFGGRQPYLRQSPSLNALLWRANPCSAIDSVESQLDAPFSAAAFMVLFVLSGSSSFSSVAIAVSRCLLALCCAVFAWVRVYD